MNEARKHIVSVSTALFLQKSFKEVTLKEIVEATGLSKGAFYHYFESKEQLFAEVADQLIAVLVGAHLEKMDHSSLSAFYRDYINYFVDSLHKNDTGGSANYFSLIFDALKLIPDFHNQLLHTVQTAMAHWTEAIRNARAAGEIDTDMEDRHIAQLFAYSADGIGLQYLFKLADMDETKIQLQQLWDGIYRLLKR